MDNHIKKNPASVGALSRISKVTSLSNACTILITWGSIESNDDEPVTVGWARRALEKALDPEVHVGRTDAASLLAGLVDAGLLSDSEEMWLYQVAELVAEESKPEIDPLLEVARRVLAMRLEAGGRRG